HVAVAGAAGGGVVDDDDLAVAGQVDVELARPAVRQAPREGGQGVLRRRRRPMRLEGHRSWIILAGAAMGDDLEARLRVDGHGLLIIEQDPNRGGRLDRPLRMNKATTAPARLP